MKTDVVSISNNIHAIKAKVYNEVNNILNNKKHVGGMEDTYFYIKNIFYYAEKELENYKNKVKVIKKRKKNSL